MMTRLVTLVVIPLGILFAACSTNLERSNPFDPQTPQGQQARAGVSGTVEGDGGGLVANANVTLTSLATLASDALTTGADGRFAFDDLAAGEYELTVTHAVHLPFTRDLTLQPGVARELAVVLVPLPDYPGAEVGQIIGAVLLEGEQGKEPAAQDHSGTLVEVVGTGVRTTTGTDGSFDLRLSPGSYDLAFSARDHLGYTHPDVVVVAEAVADIGNVVLAGNPGAVVGQVRLENVDRASPTYPADLPGADVTVALVGANDGPTAPDGSFRVTAPAGTYIVSITKPGFVTDNSRVAVIRGGLETTLPEVRLLAARGAVTGRVSLDGRVDAGGATISLTGTLLATTSTPAGEFAIWEVPVGTYELTVQRDSYQTRSVSAVPVTASGSTDVGEITLVRQTGQFAINGGAEFTNDALVTLDLGPQDAAAMRVSEDHAFADPSAGETAFRTFEEEPTFELSSGDGTKTVYVQLQDISGTSSDVFSASIVLDTTPPGPVSVRIDGGAPYSIDSGGVVGLTLTALDAVPPGVDRTSGVSAMRVANAQPFGAITFTPYEMSRAWVLDDPTHDGVRTVYAEFRDGAGNVSVLASDEITLDRVPPSLVTDSFQINAGAAYSRLGTVTLTLESPDAALMALSAAEGFPVKVFEPLAETRFYTLSPGDGSKTVYLLLMDAAGNESAAFSTSITLDTQAPSNVVLTATGSVADGASSTHLTRLRDVDLSIQATDPNGLDQLWISHSASFAGATPQTFTTAISDWRLPDADGSHAIYLKVSDVAGNEATTATTIALDRAPPDLPSVSIVETPYATTTDVSLLLGAVGAAEMFIDGDVTDTATTREWISYAPTQGVSLTASPEGAKTVTVRFRDVAGNETAAQTTTTWLDTAGPSATSLTLEGLVADGAHSATLTHSTTVTARPAATGAAEVMLANDSAFTGGVWVAYNPGMAVPWTLPPGDGTGKTVHARFRDAAGNLGGPATAQIELDTTPPGAATIRVAGGATHTGTAAVSVATGASGATQMRISTDGAFDGVVDGAPAAWESWAAYATAGSVTLPAGDGPKTVYAAFRDAAGNETPSATDSIVLDTSAPTAPSVGIEDNGSGFVSTVSVTLAVGVSPGNNELAEIQLQLRTDAAFDNEPWMAFTASPAVVLPGGDCAAADCKQVCARFRDPALNTSAPVCATVTLDGTPPTTPVLVTTSETVNTAGPTYDVQILAPVDDVFFDHYAVDVTGPSGSTTTSLFPDPDLLETTFSVPITEGTAGAATSTIRIYGVDQAGNRSSDAVAVITEDSVSPEPPLLDPPAQTVVNADVLSIGVSRFDPASQDATFSHFEAAVTTAAACPTDAASYIAAGGTTKLDFFLTQGDGNQCSGVVPCSQRLCARGVDAAGNVGDASSVSIQEDSVPPTVPTVAPKHAEVNADTVRIQLAVPSTDHTPLVYEQLGGQYAVFTEPTVPGVLDFDIQQDHSSDLCVRARDAAGNVSPADCATIVEQSTKRVTQSDEWEKVGGAYGDWVLYEYHAMNDPSGPAPLYLHNMATGQREYVGYGNRAVLAGSLDRIVVVWDSYSTVWDIYARVRNADGTWDAAVNVTQYFNDNSSSPSTNAELIVWRTNTTNDVYRITVDLIAGLTAANSPSRIGKMNSTEKACTSVTPVVNGSSFAYKVFYCVDNGNGTYDLWRYSYSFLTGASRQEVAANITNLQQVVLDERYLVFTKDSASGRVLYWMDQGGAPYSHTNTGVIVSHVGDVWSPPSDPVWGYTFNARIAYKKLPLGETIEQIYVYELATPPRNELVVETSFFKREVFVEAGRLIFAMDPAQIPDVFLFDQAETNWVSVHPGAQRAPKVDGDLVIWGDLRNGTYDLGVYDLGSGMEHVITQVNSPPQALGGATVGWSTNEYGAQEARIIDIADPLAPVETVLSGSLLSYSATLSVAGGGGRAAWSEAAGVRYTNLPTVAPVTVPGSVNGFFPDIEADTVVWVDPTDGFRTYCYDVSLGQGGLVSSGLFPRVGPPMVGSAVDLVYLDDSQILNAGLSYCKLTCDSTPTCSSSKMLEPPGTLAASFDVGDGVVAWQRQNPNGEGDVKVLDLSVGAVVTMSPGISATTSQVSPSTSGGVVVWEDSRGGDADIYFYRVYR